MGQRFPNSSSSDNTHSISSRDLFDAIEDNDLEQIQRLVLLPSFKNFVNLKDDDAGQTALMYACCWGRFEIAYLLLEHGAVVKKNDNPGDFNELHCCCAGDRFETISDDATKQLVSLATMLLSRRPEMINESDKEGSTPLHFACERFYAHLVTLLISKGANMLDKDIRWQTPLHAACEVRYGSTERFSDERKDTIREILAYSAALNVPMDSLLLQRDKHGSIPFQYVATKESAKLLLECPFAKSNTRWISHEMIEAKFSDDRAKYRDGASIGFYLSSFLLKPLAVPERSINHDGSNPPCVKLNPDLDNFQVHLAQSILLLLLLKIPHNDLVFEILGYLTPIDVMKRSRPLPWI